MTSAERAASLVYWTNLLRMTDEAEASRVIAEAIDAAVAEALPRWVPVGERLPDHCCDVLVSTAKTDWRAATTSFGWYSPSRGEWVFRGEKVEGVVAWQPLPAPWVAP